jgi:iron(III) transport system permease protein
VALEESSRVFGASPWRTLLRITLPILRPAILAAFVLGVVRSPPPSRCPPCSACRGG